MYDHVLFLHFRGIMKEFMSHLDGTVGNGQHLGRQVSLPKRLTALFSDDLFRGLYQPSVLGLERLRSHLRLDLREQEKGPKTDQLCTVTHASHRGGVTSSKLESVSFIRMYVPQTTESKTILLRKHQLLISDYKSPEVKSL
jgi:hypothetical protein